AVATRRTRSTTPTMGSRRSWYSTARFLIPARSSCLRRSPRRRSAAPRTFTIPYTRTWNSTKGVILMAGVRNHLRRLTAGLGRAGHRDAGHQEDRGHDEALHALQRRPDRVLGRCHQPRAELWLVVRVPHRHLPRPGGYPELHPAGGVRPDLRERTNDRRSWAA